MTLPDLLALPDYEADASQPLPLYSAEARSSECLLQLQPPQRTGCPACEWVFASKHLKFNLGPRIWKLASPSYGLHASIEGSIAPSDPGLHHVESIQITLEGRVKMTSPGSTDSSAAVFLSYSVSLAVNPDMAELAFSVPIPTAFAHNGKKVRCPPSFSFADSGYTLQVSYDIRFDAVLRTKKRRRSESRVVNFFYLPKTAPMVPPICALPPASRHCENPPLFLEGAGRMHCFPIPPSFPSKRKLALTPSQLNKLEELRNSLYFSLPSPATFSAGQDIPFMLSLSFPHDPYLAEIYCESIAIHLYKRVGFHMTPRTGSCLTERNTLVSSATVRKNSGWAEGVVVLKGEMRAGIAGAECSWSVPGTSHVKYILRVCLRPPPSFSCHIPTFIHEEEINICTSPWGSIEQELISSCGSTTPALGLSSQ